MSSEGTTALFGAPGDNQTPGATWVFTRSSTTWTQQGAKLAAAANGEIGEGLFGRSVAISAEGTTALIGDYGDGFDGVHGDTGAAWVFTRSGTAWSLQGGKLTGGNSELGEGESGGRGEVGYSVALSPKATPRWSAAPLQRQRRRGVGVHALGLDLGPAGQILAASSEEAGTGDCSATAWRCRQKAHAYALIGGAQQRRRQSARRGSSRARARPGPSRAPS